MQAPSILSTLPPSVRGPLTLARLRAGTRGPGAIPLPSTHTGQDEVLASRARFRILNCGRRWRKSSTVLIALIRAAEARPGGLYWWVWPTFPMARTGWTMLYSATAAHAETWESTHHIRLRNGAEIWLKSADHE